MISSVAARKVNNGSKSIPVLPNPVQCAQPNATADAIPSAILYLRDGGKAAKPMKGRCTICGRIRNLTRDHVPPRSIVQPTLLEVRSLGQYLGCRPTQPRRARGSVIFRTLCADCNGSRLGREYDPHLKELCNEVAVWVRSHAKQKMVLPRSFAISAKPNRIARALIGHVLAAENRQDRYAELNSAPMPAALRDFFLDEAKPMPSRLEIYCWPYPSDLQVIIRSTSILRYGRNGQVVGDFLKFFPVGFWLAWDRPETVSLRLGSLPRLKRLDDEAEIRLYFDPIPYVDWPENPAGDFMMYFSSEQTCIARPTASSGLRISPKS